MPEADQLLHAMLYSTCIAFQTRPGIGRHASCLFSGSWTPQLFKAQWFLFLTLDVLSIHSITDYRMRVLLNPTSVVVMDTRSACCWNMTQEMPHLEEDLLQL